ncbi:hypothetical protein PSEWESI4_02730 [Pseudomonas carbonaria]|uniref:Uncharacterized protein n=1 Tax=Zestomonas carbonaria TaxID=2762745 RepID=A0A7U7I9M5_9GAMM|nr:hypothetical protein PSEWESI4_02730 [Pseudomonas carbonaria]
MFNPEYIPGHGLLRGKLVLITDAAQRAAEEGCRALMISDIHTGRAQIANNPAKYAWNQGGVSMGLDRSDFFL